MCRAVQRVGVRVAKLVWDEAAGWRLSAARAAVADQPRPRIRNGNLPLIHATAAELGWVPLKDALAILLVIDSRDEERFNSPAVRWAGRLALEVSDLELV